MRDGGLQGEGPEPTRQPENADKLPNFQCIYLRKKQSFHHNIKD